MIAAQSVLRDELVCLEGGKTFGGPITDGASRVLRVVNNLVAEKTGHGAIHERTRQMYFRAGHPSCVDTPLQVQLDIRMIGPCCSNRRETEGQKQAGGRKRLRVRVVVR